MKVIMMQKRVSTTVITGDVVEAAGLLIGSQECSGFDVVNLTVVPTTIPNAYRQTCDFAEQTGVYVLGYDAAESKATKADPTKATPGVWVVTVDLQYTVDFSPPQPRPTRQQVKEDGPDLELMRPDLTDVAG